MSIIDSITNQIKGQDIHTLGWVLGLINWNKLKYRIEFAKQNPEKTVKCVLLEYKYTSLADVRQHNIENIMDLVPNSGMIANSAIRRPEFIKLLHSIIAGGNRDIQIYTRKKIENGNINFHSRQLVLVVKAWTFPPKLMRHNAWIGEQLENIDNLLFHST